MCEKCHSLLELKVILPEEFQTQCYCISYHIRQEKAAHSLKQMN